jgi:hypothetical protein
MSPVDWNAAAAVGARSIVARTQDLSRSMGNRSVEGDGAWRSAGSQDRKGRQLRGEGQGGKQEGVRIVSPVGLYA